MDKKLGFKDFLAVDYAPGMPDIIKKNAKKRKQDTPTGNTNEAEHDPIGSGKHAKNIGMGWTGKHKVIKDPGSKKGRHTHVFQYTEETDEVDEALTAQQRRARARLLKRYASRIKMGRERAKRRFASPEKLKKRARKAARELIFKKISKDIPKSELTFARRQEIEKRLDTPAMKKKIDRLATKLLPKTRKAEMEKKRGSKST